MNKETLAKANIENLSNSWKSMGAGSLDLNQVGTINASSDWPFRRWYDWDHTTGPEHVRALGHAIAESLEGIVLPVWHKRDEAMDAELAASGFSLMFEQTAMVLDLSKTVAAPVESLDFTEVENTQDVAVWTDIASRSFGSYIDPSVMHGVAQKPEFKLILATRDGAPMGTSLLFTDSDVVGIHLVGVPPEARRQGIARQSMLRSLQLAQASGESHAVLQASAMGEPLYLELGFETQFSYANFSNLAAEGWKSFIQKKIA